MICHVFKRGRLYWGKLQLPHETRVARISLGTTDRRVAQAKLWEMAQHREKVHAGLAPPDSVREAAQKPLAAILRAFLRHLETNRRSATTVATYRKILGKLFGRCRWVVLGDVSTRSFTAWRDQCGLSAKTLNDLLGALNSFFRWLVFQGLVLENPFARVPQLRAKVIREPYRRSFTREELNRLLAVAPPHRRIVYLVGVYTGLRRTEMIGLRWMDFVLDGARPHVKARASLAGNKSRKDAEIPLHPDAVAELKKFRPANAAPFSPVLAGLVPRIPTFRKDLVAAGIAFTDPYGRRADLHALRDTFVTELVLAGNPPEVVMKLARHSDLRVTMRHYVDARRLPLAEGVARLPTFGSSEVCPKTCPNGGQNGPQAVAS